MTRRFLRRFHDDTAGATALELGLVLPMVLILVVGVINTSLLASSISGMNFAVQEAARCYAVNKTACATPTAAKAYAEGKYVGPGVEPTFVANTTGCGHTVQATATYDLDVVFYRFSLPLSASACYPGKVAAAA